MLPPIVGGFESCDDLDGHRCHFCGTDVCRHGYEFSRREPGEFTNPPEYVHRPEKRHFLSDCRPDLTDGSYDGHRYSDGPM